MKYTSGVKLSASKNHTSLLRVSEGEMSSKIANSCTGENYDYFLWHGSNYNDFVS